jgi:hypothetical protein
MAPAPVRLRIACASLSIPTRKNYACSTLLLAPKSAALN